MMDSVGQMAWGVSPQWKDGGTRRRLEQGDLVKKQRTRREEGRSRAPGLLPQKEGGFWD